MRDGSSVEVLCAEYQRLLKECQLALTRWNRGRAEIHNSGRRDRAADNELRILQGNFAKAWAVLQTHEHACEMCHIMAVVDARHDSLHQFCN